MAAKHTYDAANLEIVIDKVAPDGNGILAYDIQIDLYSDAKEDWQANLDEGGGDGPLGAYPFPVTPIGGEPVGGGDVLGDTYLLTNGWKIRPQSINHTLSLVGNLFSDDGLEPVLDPIGTFSVRVEKRISTLVESVSVPSSGLTPGEASDLAIVRKAHTNRQELDDQGVFRTYDDDDSTLVDELDQTVTDKEGKKIDLPRGATAKRSKGAGV